ncbi:MAG: VOC family protein [Thermomicrobiales bacterium]
MHATSIYLLFNGTAEAAFTFYQQVFAAPLVGQVFRFGDIPADAGAPPVADDQKNLIMNIGMRIPGNVLLMASDVAPGMGGPITVGTNVQIGLHADSREEADAVYAALSDGGDAHMPMADQFWGDYYGELTDRFGIVWLVFHNDES